ncbi:MAG TPA: 50S ribosomal protein L19 [Candidatus Babeliales bacterium]|nr:50S ribosomal protein L19 [Candidatus Babeliales bacterium]
MRASKYTKETINTLGIAEQRNFPDFAAGDTIAVSVRILEGDKERIQVFQGDVIAIHTNGISSTFTVRKLGANNVFVERIFPYYAPVISSIEFIRKGKVRRAKLFYVRDRVGRSARIAEDIQTREQKLARAEIGRNKSAVAAQLSPAVDSQVAQSTASVEVSAPETGSDNAAE